MGLRAGVTAATARSESERKIFIIIEGKKKKKKVS
jgi:hypothetical protein